MESIKESKTNANTPGIHIPNWIFKEKKLKL